MNRVYVKFKEIRPTTNTKSTNAYAIISPRSGYEPYIPEKIMIDTLAEKNRQIEALENEVRSLKVMDK